MRGNIVGRTGLKLQRRTLEGGMLKAHVLNHLTTPLIRRQLLQPSLFAIEHANACGTIDLVSAEDKEIAVDVLDIHLEVGRTLSTVDHHGHTMLVGNAHDVLHRIDRTKDVAHMTNRYDARLLSEKASISLHVEDAVIAHRYDLKHNALLACLQLPGHDIGVVLHCGDDDFIAFLHTLVSESAGDQVQSLGGATGEDDLCGGLGIEKSSYRFTCLLVQLGSLLAHPVHAPVYIGIDIEVFFAHSVQDTEWFLCRSRIVEIDQRLVVDFTRQYREIFPHLIDIVHS